MCGRTACNLGKECIQNLCQKLDFSHCCSLLEWVDCSNGSQYVPSYNLAPTSICPVILSTCHAHLAKFESQFQNSPYCIQPMKWGLTAPWDSKKILNNCRSDGIESKPTFNKLLDAGQRCIVLAEGYYEWQTDEKLKKPYFFYFSENSQIYSGMKIENQPESHKEDPKPVKLLTMAGLFGLSRCNKTHEIIYEYIVITVNASKDYQFVHDRMPAILEGDEISKWLDYKNYSTEQVLGLLRPTNRLQCHRVSMYVNKSSEKSIKCILPIDPYLETESSPYKKSQATKKNETPKKNEKTPKKGKKMLEKVQSNSLDSWLSLSNSKKKLDMKFEESSKRMKME